MPRVTENKFIEWKFLSPKDWDTVLSNINGHPLQSAQWGNAREVVHGMKYHRLALFQDNQPIYLVRIEERRFCKKIKIAWIPKGPCLIDMSK